MKKVLLFSLIVAFTISLNAQTLDNKWGIGIGLGGYGTINNGGIGLMPELYFSRYLNPRLDFMLKGNMGLANSILTNELDMVNPFLNLRYKLRNDDKNFRPYLFAGPGLLYNNRTSAVNFNVGFGGKFYSSQKTAFYVEAGYIYGIESMSRGIMDRENFWKATIGLEFDFGKAKDSDMDGVPDKKDKCPDTPAGVAVDANGCPLVVEKVVAKVDVVPEVSFTADAPKNIPVERRVRETFPLRNYVFFNLGSTEIPDRYVLLTKGQVKDFKEDQLEVFAPKRLSGRSDRQLIVYYNLLNILGDRMGKNPTATVKLIGSSMEGTEDGVAMAESVKQYLVTVFGINASRISIEGNVKPKIPSEQPGGTKELDLLREGDRRVSIESSSPAILTEFQSGTNTSINKVELYAIQKSPLDSYVSFNVLGAKEAFTTWSLEIADEQGKVQKFGPYTHEIIRIPGKSILGTQLKGDYKVIMIGQTKDGKIIKKGTSLHLELWTPSEREEGMRFSVIYEFNDSKASTIYEKYLTETLTPTIPKGGKVIIHGYTDIIGNEANNQKLSLARANDVKSIIENALSKAGRSDVKFEVYGFGEDENLSPFENNFPEERFYNRSVIIDIIPTI